MLTAQFCPHVSPDGASALRIFEQTLTTESCSGILTQPLDRVSSRLGDVEILVGSALVTPLFDEVRLLIGRAGDLLVRGRGYSRSTVVMHPPLKQEIHTHLRKTCNSLRKVQILWSHEVRLIPLCQGCVRQPDVSASL